MNNTVQVYRKSGQSETVNPAKRNRPFSIENERAVLGTRELPFLRMAAPICLEPEMNLNIRLWGRKSRA